MPLSELDQESNKSTKYETSENNVLEDSDNKGYNNVKEMADNVYNISSVQHDEGQNVYIPLPDYERNWNENNFRKNEVEEKKNEYLQNAQTYLLEKHGVKADLTNLDPDVVDDFIEEYEVAKKMFPFRNDKLFRLDSFRTYSEDELKSHSNTLGLTIKENDNITIALRDYTQAKYQSKMIANYQNGNASSDSEKSPEKHEIGHLMLHRLREIVKKSDNIKTTRIYNDFENEIKLIKSGIPEEKIPEKISRGAYKGSGIDECFSESIAKYMDSNPRNISMKVIDTFYECLRKMEEVLK